MSEAKSKIQERYWQCQAVDPENHLGARTLERDWEERWQALAPAEQESQRAQREAPRALDEEERAGLVALAQDRPALWVTERATLAERKEVLPVRIQRCNNEYSFTFHVSRPGERS